MNINLEENTHDEFTVLYFFKILKLNFKLYIYITIKKISKYILKQFLKNCFIFYF